MENGQEMELAPGLITDHYFGLRSAILPESVLKDLNPVCPFTNCFSSNEVYLRRSILHRSYSSDLRLAIHGAIDIRA